MHEDELDVKAGASTEATAPRAATRDWRGLGGRVPRVGRG